MHPRGPRPESDIPSRLGSTPKGLSPGPTRLPGPQTGLPSTTNVSLLEEVPLSAPLPASPTPTPVVGLRTGGLLGDYGDKGPGVPLTVAGVHRRGVDGGPGRATPVATPLAPPPPFAPVCLLSRLREREGSPVLADVPPVDTGLAGPHTQTLRPPPSRLPTRPRPGDRPPQGEVAATVLRGGQDPHPRDVDGPDLPDLGVRHRGDGGSQQRVPGGS